ncbi:MAG TPA: 3-dehydroquinate synthase [Geobacteraceae bacterium]|nr:3-dehydroquinate synthase [Geobacteraceae bacterium]
MHKLLVSLGERSYTIQIGTGLLSSLGEYCADYNLGASAAIVTNTTVRRLYADAVRNSLLAAGYVVHLVEIPDGESYKNSVTLNHIYDALLEANLSRDSFLVALGGGVVGDVAGFAAATFLRGVPFVQVPTTLLAQVDSSVGGKTGINHPLGKNLIGAFYQPSFVLIDTATLDTLPQREYLSGLAEVLKYGMVCDGSFFSYLERNIERLRDRDMACLQEVIARSCAIKASVVERDEKEGGFRAVLNYGHTYAHAIERLTGYTRFLHGEAVAIGMVQAAKLSQIMGYSSEEDTKSLVSLLKSLDLPIEPVPYSVDEYREALLKDKKKRARGILFVFNKGIGETIIENVADMKVLLQVLSM